MNFVQKIGADFAAAGAFAEHLVAKLEAAGGSASNGSATQVTQTAATIGGQLSTLGTTVEQALPAGANLVVNFALGFVPEGATFAPLADSFIDEIIAQLLAKKSTPATATS